MARILNKLFKNSAFQIILINTMVIFLFAGCSSDGKKKSKSMEQIQKEHGFPVEVQKVAAKKFEEDLTFYGKFRGIKETTIGAIIGGRVDKILAKPSDKVKKNQIIIMFPNDAPASQIQQAKAAFENSRKTYKRMNALLVKGEIAQAQFDAAKTKFIVDKRNFETLKQTLHLDAPYNGTITQIIVHEGDNVKKKAPLFTVAKLNQMKIRLWLSDKERMKIKKGMTVFATVGNKTFSGKITIISLGEDPSKQAFYADAVFNNDKSEILSGTTADVKIEIYSNDNAIVIPRNLVKFDGNKAYVFLAENSNGKILAKKQYVKINHSSGINYEIGSGLSEGDLLITKGNARISDGIKIKVVK